MKVQNLTDRPRVIAATQTEVPPGGTVEVDSDLGKALCDQSDVWGKPTISKKQEDN